MKKITAALFTVALVMSAGGTAPAGGESGPGYLLNLYHFNIQYVVGHDPSMRRIVKQSFEPLVDFYIEHPDWGADFEMQGLMIEYMADHFPEVLEKFKTIVNSGQVSLVTFHYADQLLLAFPYHDQDWSLRINERVLEKHGIKRSRVIFAQEAQFGEGYAVFAKKYGYDAAIITAGHYAWFHDDDRFPFFTVNGLKVLLAREGVEPRTGIRVKWQFLGDGELVVTGGMSPYFPGLFRKRPALIKRYERRMKAAEARGYKPVKISEYVAALKAAGVEPVPLKPVLDSPWRPGDGSGVFQWMGKYILPWERDYDLLTRNWQVRSALIEAERAGASEQTLSAAWSYMVNAQVTDTTGWYPLPVEVNWGDEMTDQVMRVLDEDPKLDLEDLVRCAAAGPVCRETVEPPFEIRRWGRAEDGNLAWQKLEAVEGGYCISVSWTGKGDGGIAFPWTAQSVEYSPAFLECLVREIKLSEIKGKPIHLALTNGLIGLGDGFYLVRDNAKGCVAAGLDPENREITFGVQRGKEESYSFLFYLLEDRTAEEALEFANQVNRVHP